MALDKSLFAQKIQQQSTDDPSVDVEDLRARVLSRVRHDNPEALKNPRFNEGYLRSVVMQESGIAPNTVNSIVEDMLGYGPFQRFIYPDCKEFENITEIMATRHDLVYVEKDGRLIKTDIRFRDEQHLLTTIRKIVATCGRRLSASESWVDAFLPDGSRVTVNIPPSTRFPTMTIRRFPRLFSLQELVESGAITPALLVLLQEAVREGWSCVFSGAMGSGKSTLLNATAALIKCCWGPEASLVVFEDVPELCPDHENTRYFTGQPPMPDGTGGVSLAGLARSVLLRLRPDWLILGECRGPETYYISQSMSLGTPAFTTVHSTSAVDVAHTRFPSLIMMSEEGRAEGYKQAVSRVAIAIDMVIHMAKVRCGNHYQRRVVQVVEVLRKQTATGGAPDIRVLFQWDMEKKELVQVADTTLYAKKRQVF
jgi:pilus assembly protein CpaF